jgi:hypothetical protein
VLGNDRLLLLLAATDLAKLASVTATLEPYFIRPGPDGLTRISVRVSGQGQREWWLASTGEAEGDVMKRWAAEHMERLGFMPSWVRGWCERSRIGHHNPRVAYSPSFLRVLVADGRAKRCFASASPLGRSVDTAPEFDPASLANSHGARPAVCSSRQSHALVVRNGKGRTRKVTVGSRDHRVSAPRVNDRRTDQDGKRRRFTSRILPRTCAAPRRWPRSCSCSTCGVLHRRFPKWPSGVSI